MTSILLEIKNPGDWLVLKPLLKRLKIHFTPVETTPTPQKIARAKALEIINAGLPAFQNFEEWMQQFEESRKNCSLPFRAN
ncbi:MAG: hypothetical protein EPO28_05930 [Saprospiraceae bacterium]|nr:MAG: hypothetical protein EPO28_05930 [Saprospiraceae bacterium]